MTIEQLRVVLQEVPFRPFMLRMADGRSLAIPHRDFVALSPSGRTVIVYRDDDSFSIVDLLLVNELDVPAPAAKASEDGPNGASAS